VTLLDRGALLGLARLAAGTGALDEAAVEREARALRGRVRRRAAEEAVLQSYLFAGFPAAINGLSALRRGWPASGATGRRAASRPARSNPSQTARWRARGQDLCSRVYGPAYGRLRERMRELSRDLDEWIVTEGYGRTLGRPGLPFQARELCAIAVLAATGAARQLAAHLAGVERVGLDRRLALAAARDAARRHLRRERRTAVEDVLAAAGAPGTADAAGLAPRRSTRRSRPARGRSRAARAGRAQRPSRRRSPSRS
jgi:4-carboxymuconolactone decarboxylase